MFQRPIEEKKFEVRPMELLLCRRFFEELPVSDRLIEKKFKKDILQALNEVERKPQKYFLPFYTMMPAKTWDYMSIHNMEMYAIKRGGCLADFTVQSLEWAQRLFNGETVKDLCSTPDTAKCFRVVSRKDFYILVGGCTGDYDSNNKGIPPASYHPEYHPSCITGAFTVPLIVYKK